MGFSSYAWSLYRDTAQGKAAIERDVSAHAASIKASAFNAPFEYRLWMVPREGDEPVGPAVQDRDSLVDLRDLIHRTMAEEQVLSLEEAEFLFTLIADEGLEWEIEMDGKPYCLFYGGGAFNKEGYADVYSSIAGLSAGLFDCFPVYFFPYLFSCRFDELSVILDRYGILPPDLPGKLQKRERALYYLSVNRALQSFRLRNGLSSRELNALLYDFAPKDLAGTLRPDLSAPSRVWFAMGGDVDFEFLDNCTASSISRWQGNLETRRGDIVLMWCRSPRSALHSIWRAVDDGFNDPYFYYYSTIRIGEPIKIPQLTFAELSRHPLFAESVAVKARFQGCGGRAFTKEQYIAVCEMLSLKGFDSAILPMPPEEIPIPDLSLTCERDVEVHLLEPLLRRLGFSESDWAYQFQIRMGRGERNVPDYALGVDAKPSEESAVALIECKFDISTDRERRDAFLQGRSYALRLQSEVMAVAARRGIWLFRRHNTGFDESRFLFKSWNELSHPDRFAEVKSILGKKAVEMHLKAKKRR
ncbi:MAG: hypothetical protein AB7W37_10145 [Syntrophobacteraceae bacterium]